MLRHIEYAYEEDLSRCLPIEAYFKGFRLRWENPRPWLSADPVVLTRVGRPGEELYRWNYIPTLGEVDEVCQKLMEEQ